MNSPRRFFSYNITICTIILSSFALLMTPETISAQEQQKEEREVERTSPERQDQQNKNQPQVRKRRGQQNQDQPRVRGERRDQQADAQEDGLTPQERYQRERELYYQTLHDRGLTYPSKPVMPWDQDPTLDLERYLGFGYEDRPQQVMPWGRQQFYERQYNQNLSQQNQRLRNQRLRGNFQQNRSPRNPDQYPSLTERQELDMLDEDVQEGSVNEQFTDYYDYAARQDLPSAPRPAREGRLHALSYENLNEGWRNIVQGNFAEAANVFNRAYERYPGSGLPKIGLALVNGLDGDVNRALATFTSVLNNNPRDLNRVLNKDLITEAAVDLIERVENIENNESRHFFLMSILNYIRGDLEQAEYWLGEAGLENATFGPAGTLRNMIAKSRQVESMVPRVEEPHGLMY